MHHISLHMVEESESFSTILEKYSISDRALIRFNPSLRCRQVCPGRILYIVTETPDPVAIPSGEAFRAAVERLQRLHREDMTSYLYQYNDHVMIEEELFAASAVVSEAIFSSDRNNALLLHAHFVEIHRTIHRFIDSLRKKDEPAVEDCRDSLRTEMKSVETFLQEKHVEVAPSAVRLWLEKQLLIAAKLINGNHYEARRLCMEK